MSAPTLEKILQALNEKYGTSFEGWSQLPTVYEVGDTVPNWNAYEKIEMQSQKIAVKSKETAVGDLFIIGTLSGEDFEIITNGNQSCVVRSNGVSEGYLGPPASAFDYIKGLLQGVGLTATSISEEVVSWEPGSTVPDWSEYTQYT